MKPSHLMYAFISLCKNAEPCSAICRVMTLAFLAFSFVFCAWPLYCRYLTGPLSCYASFTAHKWFGLTRLNLKMEVVFAMSHYAMATVFCDCNQNICFLKPQWSLFITKGGHMQLYSLLSQYCGHSNRLRKCGLKKVADICSCGNSKLDFRTSTTLRKIRSHYCSRCLRSLVVRTIIKHVERLSPIPGLTVKTATFL